MKLVSKCLLAFAVISLSTLFAFAQNDEKNKVEFYAGYSWLSLDTGIDEIDPSLDGRFGSHGFNTSITGNFHRYVGIQGDFSHHSKSESFTDGTDSINVSFSTSQFLGGLQFKDNKVEGSRVRPFARILAGVAHQRVHAAGTSSGGGGGGGGGRIFGTPTAFDETASANNFAMVFGGGIDVNVSRHVSIRVIQADYNPIFFKDTDIGGETIPGRTQSNFRIGFGIVFH